MRSMKNLAYSSGLARFEAQELQSGCEQGLCGRSNPTGEPWALFTNCVYKLYFCIFMNLLNYLSIIYLRITYLLIHLCTYLYPPKGVNFGPLWRFRPWGRLLFPEVHSSFFINCCQCSGRLFTSKGRLLPSKGRLLPGRVLVRVCFGRHRSEILGKIALGRN